MGLQLYPGWSDRGLEPSCGGLLGSTLLRDSELPALYRAADRASRTAQRWYVSLTWLELSFVLLAAGISALRLAFDREGSTSATIVAIALLLALVTRMANRVRHFSKTWFDGRAVAESVKSAAWRYMMSLDQYSGSASESRDALIETLGNVAGERPELAASLEFSSAEGAFGSELSAFRALSLAIRRDRYVSERLDDQLTWYSGRSIQNRRNAALWFWIGLGAQVAAIGIAVFAVRLPGLFAAIGLLSAISAAAIAWAQLGRHDELGRSYGLAAQELMLLKSALVSVELTDEETLLSLVRDSEGSISREHTMWFTKRS